MRSPSGLVTDSMLPPMLKRNFRTTSITSASGDLESQVRSAEDTVLFAVTVGAAGTQR